MWVIPFLAVLGLPSLSFAFLNGEHHGPGMMWSGGWGGMGFGPLIMIVVVVAIVVLVVLAIRWLSGTGRDERGAYMAPQVKTALDILKDRFARGEIDIDEFETRRRALGD